MGTALNVAATAWAHLSFGRPLQGCAALDSVWQVGEA